jgi:hypothetical protein
VCQSEKESESFSDAVGLAHTDLLVKCEAPCFALSSMKPRASKESCTETSHQQGVPQLATQCCESASKGGLGLLRKRKEDCQSSRRQRV